MSPECPGAKKGLVVSISNPQPSYKPGDTISGHVFLQVPGLIGGEDNTVSIQLIGRASAEITEWSDHTGESQRSSTSRFDLFSSDHTLQTLHRGPLHIPRMASGHSNHALEPPAYEEDTSQSWPFSIIIPRQTSASSGQNLDEGGRSDNENFRRYSSIPIDKEGRVAAHPLPSCFDIQREESGPGVFLTGCIEYFLEARCLLACPSQAVVPVTIYNHPTPLGSTTRIELELSQSAMMYRKRLWRKGTELHFEIGTPVTCFLDQYGSLPFTIRALLPSSPHHPDKAKKPHQQDPVIILKALSIALDTTLSVWASRPAITSPGSQITTASLRETRQLYNTILPERLAKRICIPFGLKQQPLDLGQLLSVRMQAGTTDSGSHAERDRAISQLPRSFQTFNMKRCYQLVWEIVLDVAGEDVKLEGKADIAIL